MSKGTRVVDGRHFDLVSRWVGFDASKEAKAHAARIREAGGSARCFRLNVYTVAVYALGGQVAW